MGTATHHVTPPQYIHNLELVDCTNLLHLYDSDDDTAAGSMVSNEYLI